MAGRGRGDVRQGGEEREEEKGKRPRTLRVKMFQVGEEESKRRSVE